MDNVIEFGSFKGTKEVEETRDQSSIFVSDYLIPWARSCGIDTSSQKFKLNGATIMSCVQGMLLDGI